ncbi:hypothetical protein PsorP6_014634 [Peronosclerospora sorghi]|uniref:Uncharacterized protein n=1 Tax=Peronosclerospora sorghi TaxID=230839 RepID=A0ACC0VRG3_9STRA|nr:hypothetical protein PsorP6_014634 [Peronosclerospora sorghi]
MFIKAPIAPGRPRLIVTRNRGICMAKLLRFVLFLHNHKVMVITHDNQMTGNHSCDMMQLHFEYSRKSKEKVQLKRTRKSD